MGILFFIIIATFLISLVSFIGAITLFLKENLLNKILLLLVAFSAGALIGAAFLDLLPEAISKAGRGENYIFNIFLFLIAGFCIFFILEQFIQWHHHHSVTHPEIKSFSYLILFSDGFHNFIDGLVIAGSFIASFPLGISTSLAVVFHEIPQEIGDFAVLVYGGLGKTKALFLNFISGTLAILGGVVGFLMFKRIGENILFLLPFTAGTFIYIAASDLVPQIKEEWRFKKSLIHFIVFLAGIAIMILMKIFIKE
ncbi:MAG: ZIP family metal transporter [Candidatus Pacebacteria bacterium]|nr:ZIP family metal transporter [Candidatus Paceibacterota bacterium]